MDFAQRVYAAAAKVSGMLTTATLTPAILGDTVTAQVAFTESTEMVLGEVIALVPAITFATADLPAIALRDQVDVVGRSFTVRAIERLNDGGETRAALSKA